MKAHKKISWSPSDIDLLRAEYPLAVTANLAAKMGRSPTSVQKMAQINGICKDRTQWVNSSTALMIAGGKQTRFKPKHGRSMAKDAAYVTWCSMKQRCGYSNHKSYANYGGRGITVCERWLSFENFLSDMGDPPAAGMTLGRIDNESGYTPENCRWETKKQQARNRKSSRYVEAFGRRMVFAEASEEFGIRGDTLSWRLKNGMSPEDALTKPVQSRKQTRELRDSEQLVKGRDKQGRTTWRVVSATRWSA